MYAASRPNDTSADPRLRLENISKSFPGVQALRNVSLEVRPGEVHALLGENGAGKSTLVNIISGALPSDGGAAELDGVSLAGINEADAGALGIGVVHQEGSLVQQLSVAENIFAGRQPVNRFGLVQQRQMRQSAQKLLRQLGVELDPNLLVGSISPAEAQAVEIAKALSRDLRLLILDEPTAALTLTESERLFELIRALAGRGVAVIYISHRLAEIFEICHRVTVLKDGEVSGMREVADSDQDELIRLMVGRNVHLGESRGGGAERSEVVLEVRDLAAPPYVKRASFKVHAGEIVCLAGLIGSGRTEVCETVFGARKRSAGEIFLDRRPVSFTHPSQSMHSGLAMVPEDRKEAGLFLTMDIASNIGVTNLDTISPGGVVSRTRMRRLAEAHVESLGISTPSVYRMTDKLSGGNQQKVLLAKWLARDPKLLIVDEPTRGVDVGARSEIYKILRGLAAKGVALLVVSSDLPEVLTLADRIVVMAEGETVSELDRDQASEEAIIRHAAQFEVGNVSA